jgi:hypothetical protein
MYECIHLIYTYYVCVYGVSLCVVCMCECAAKVGARADLREETESALRRQRILGFFPKRSLSLALPPPSVPGAYYSSSCEFVMHGPFS